MCPPSCCPTEECDCPKIPSVFCNTKGTVFLWRELTGCCCAKTDKSDLGRKGLSLFQFVVLSLYLCRSALLNKCLGDLGCQEFPSVTSKRGLLCWDHTNGRAYVKSLLSGVCSSGEMVHELRDLAILLCGWSSDLSTSCRGEGSPMLEATAPTDLMTSLASTGAHASVCVYACTYTC